MAILNWRDHPRLRFVDFPPPFLAKGSVFIASDRNDSAWMSDGTTYYPLYGSGLEAPHLGRKTWAELPNPLTVPEGTGATLYGWMAPEAEWLTWSGYWVPKGGRAVVHAPLLVNAQAQSAVNALVASVPTWTAPASLLSNPLLNIEVWVSATSQNISNAQTRNLHVGAADLSDSIIAGTVVASTNAYRRVWGKLEHRSDTTNFIRGAYHSQPYADSPSGDVPVANLLAAPIGVWYRGGATDGSEIATFHNFSIIVGTY